MKWLKTVSEVSKDLGVSKQTIYKKINSQLKVELKKHIKKGSKGIEIAEKGIEIIKQSLNDEVSTFQPVVENELLVQLNRMIESLENQLITKDNQLSTMQKQSENMQILMLGLQQQNQLLLEGSSGSEVKEKRNFFFWNRSK